MTLQAQIKEAATLLAVMILSAPPVFIIADWLRSF